MAELEFEPLDYICEIETADLLKELKERGGHIPWWEAKDLLDELVQAWEAGEPAHRNVVVDRLRKWLDKPFDMC